MTQGRIVRVSGSVVVVSGLATAGLNHRVSVGCNKLAGEIIRIRGDEATLQVYESTEGLRINDPVEDSGQPFSVTLGPGLLGQVFDGIQRPLDKLRQSGGDFIARGSHIDFSQDERRWEVRLKVAPGDRVEGGVVLAEVDETPGVVHRIICPPNISGVIAKTHPGALGLKDKVCELDDGRAICLSHTSPSRIPRPHRGKAGTNVPHITGQRVLDSFFPIGLGGVAVLPGGFGTGKTVLEQALAQHIDADIVVYVGCGERGNEMSELLRAFRKLGDPRTGRPLMERTILVVNTSNMPVAAREASIYTGVTMAEYYRDMGHKVVLLADSISRWGEALREISSRLEEMPGEEGYPSYLSSRLSQFFERAGKVKGLAGNDGGSLTIATAVSPPGGDLSEPVTQVSLRVAGCFWALDPMLASKRHYPAVDWRESFTLYQGCLQEQHRGMGGDEWLGCVKRLEKLLVQEESAHEIAQLVGYDALQDAEKLVIATGRAIREGFLRQNYYHPEDSFCEPEKSAMMMALFLDAHDRAHAALGEGVEYEDPFELIDFGELVRLKYKSLEECRALVDERRSQKEHDKAGEEEADGS